MRFQTARALKLCMFENGPKTRPDLTSASPSSIARSIILRAREESSAPPLTAARIGIFTIRYFCVRSTVTCSIRNHCIADYVQGQYPLQKIAFFKIDDFYRGEKFLRRRGDQWRFIEYYCRTRLLNLSYMVFNNFYSFFKLIF